MAVEIERKWLAASVPDFVYQWPFKEVVQGYLCTDPVVRIRRSADKYYITYKSRGDLVREEVELPLTKESFEHLLPKCDGIIIEKTRYKIPINMQGVVVDSSEQQYDQEHSSMQQRSTDESGTTLVHLIAEVDLFHGFYEGRIYVEVEFPSIELAEAFAAPEWFGEEVTGKPGYSNAELSRM